jgi:hypothetical protein
VFQFDNKCMQCGKKRSVFEWAPVGWEKFMIIVCGR